MMNIINDYINTFKQAPYWLFCLVFIILIGLEFNSSPGISTYFWSPPRGSKLVTADGFFVPATEPKCASISCIPSPIKFRTTAGEILNVNCEPNPPLNMCVQAFAPASLGSPTRPVRIQYLKIKSHSIPDDYKIIMSISSNNSILVSYGERLNEIRHTYINSGKYVNFSRGEYLNYWDITFFLIKDIFTWGIFILCLSSKVSMNRERENA